MQETTEMIVEALTSTAAKLRRDSERDAYQYDPKAQKEKLTTATRMESVARSLQIGTLTLEKPSKKNVVKVQANEGLPRHAWDVVT